MNRKYLLDFVIVACFVLAAVYYIRRNETPIETVKPARSAPAKETPNLRISRPPAFLRSNQFASTRTAGIAGAKPEKTPAYVQEALNQQIAYDKRREAIASISDLSGSGAQVAWADYLTRPLPCVDAGWWEQEYDLRNNMLNKLREYSTDPGVVTEALLKIYANPDQGKVMRSYAIQHIAAWMNSGNPAAGDKDRLLDAVRDAAAKVDDPVIGGAGLIAMRDAGPQNEAGKMALSALDRGQACAEARISAFQVCAELGMNEALSPARTALADRNEPVILRMSAAALLARLGGDEDMRLLREMSSGDGGSISARPADQNVSAARHGSQEEFVRNAARFALASRRSEGK